MFWKALLLGLLCVDSLVLSLNANPRGLIEIDESGTKDNRIGSNNGAAASPTESNDEDDDGGIKIVGPENPSEPGDSLNGELQIPSLPGGSQKPNEADPWKPFLDPNNKNSFGQTFPKPEEVPVVPNRPENKFPVPEPELPESGANEVPHVTTPKSETNFPVPTPETPSSGHHQSNNGGFQELPPAGATEPPVVEQEEPQEPEHKEPEIKEPDHKEHKHNKEPETPITTPKPTPKPESNNGKDKPGHGGHLGGILNGWKDIVDKNKDAVHKAVDSVKEAGEKVVEAGKDVLGAGLQIGESLGLGKLHHKDKPKKHGGIFGGLFGTKEE